MDGTAQNGTTASLPPLQEQETLNPVQHAPSTCDEQIMQAMKRLANVLRKARREAGEATKLSTFIGLGVDPERDVELGDLLKTTVASP
ncbi:hypothetical protein Q7P35_005406 [Cladosporium inversicolor]